MGASNRELDAAWAYHNGTKHSFWSIRHNAHFLDSSIKPLQFKIYTDLPPVELPREVPPLEMPALASIALSGDEPAGAAVPDLRALVQVLYYSAGITKHKKYPGGEILFRAASCTGALYEIELYVVCGDLEDLSAGVYHFNPGDLALRRLRTGDFRRLITSATGEEPATAEAPALIICSGTYWRNSWKYQSRTYRHFGWDNGTLLGNLLATAAALGLPARVVMGFVDEPVNDLLALDTTREVAFSIVALGSGSPLQSEPPAIEPLALRTIPLSTREVDYPAMREMHAASSLITTDEARQWRGHTPISEPPSAGELIPLRPADDEFAPSDGLGAVIMRRGSTRRFDRKKTLSFEQFSILLDRSLREISADFVDSAGPHLNEAYLIVHAIEGLAPGAYFLHRDRWMLECLKEGDFRAEAGYLGLEQDLPADACFTVFLVADLPSVLERFGNRGYRAAQLEAGIIGGKMYLAAYAQGFGATGLTFYDDDVIKFFSPHAEGKSAIFYLAFGKAAANFGF